MKNSYTPQYQTFTLAILFVSLTTLLSAQSSVFGDIHDASDAPVSFASVVLYNLEDSSFAYVEMTDDDGHYNIDQVSEGDYYMQVSFAGLPDYKSSAFTVSALESKEMQLITMQASDNVLTEVTVRAQRPIVELKNDRTVFNVKGSINATGYNGLELLRKSPGVLVDNNDNINILGKPGVIVYIDDKRSPLSGEDLANYLRTLQASQIDAIEIITNPSSKYDAQGNAGIINIKLVKAENVGTNGTASLDFRQGKYTTTGITTTINHRTTNLNIYGTLGGNIGTRYQDIEFLRNLPTQYVDSDLFGLDDSKTSNIRFGIDYYLSPKSTIGFLTNNNFSNYEFNSTSSSFIRSQDVVEFDSVLRANSYADSDDRNHHFNLNYHLKVNDNSSLNIDADFATYIKERETDQPNTYMTLDGETLSTRNFYTESPTDIDILTFKADYELPLFEGQLGFGSKYSAVTTDNDFKFFNVASNGSRIPDPGQTNQFVYDENVLAAYANYSKNLNDAITLQLGLRMESTDSEGDLTSLDNSQNRNVQRTYVDWFPSFGLSYEMNEKNSFNFSYSRRLNRPSYQNLNPFLFRIDEITFSQGNAFLNPEYSHSFQVSHSWNYKINTSFTYTRTDDLIARVVDRDLTSDKATYISYFNLDQQDHYSLNISSPTSVTDWWSSFISATGYIIHNQSAFSENREVDLTVTALNLYWQQTFTINPTTTFELSGWYNSPSVWEGNFHTDSQWALDIGVQKKVLDGRGSLKLTGSDLFKTAPWSGYTELGNSFRTDGQGAWDSRQFRLSFSYNFGNQKVKSRKRKTGLEDESKRVG